MSANTTRLADAVAKRRGELDLTHEQLARAGGPSTTTLTKIERGGAEASLATPTLRKLDKSLRWRPGSARQVIQGGDPTPLESVDADEPEDLPTRLVDLFAQTVEFMRTCRGAGVSDEECFSFVGHATHMFNVASGADRTDLGDTHPQEQIDQSLRRAGRLIGAGGEQWETLRSGLMLSRGLLQQPVAERATGQTLEPRTPVPADTRPLGRPKGGLSTESG